MRAVVQRVSRASVSVSDRSVSEIEQGLLVRTGVFGANMTVESVNRGPLTILIDSRKLF